MRAGVATMLGQTHDVTAEVAWVWPGVALDAAVLLSVALVALLLVVLMTIVVVVEVVVCPTVCCARVISTLAIRRKL